MFATTKLMTGAVTGVLTLAVTGAAAFAAFQPGTDTATMAASDTGAPAGLQAEVERPKTGIKDVLDKLVQNGTITQAQEDAILQALKDAAAAREGAALVKRVLADLMKLSVDYIGLPKEAVAGQLKAGKSLGEIADQRPGKSRQGLIDHLVAQVSAQLDKLVADGKITQERADQAKADLVEHVTKFVDHKVERKPAPPKERKPERTKPALKPTPTPTPAA